MLEKSFILWQTPPTKFAVSHTASQLKRDLYGGKPILVSDNEAACNSLTKGAATTRLALILGYTLWSAAGKFDLVFWKE